jgi:RNA polymerase sigma-70 factor (ECF subfamily)
MLTVRRRPEEWLKGFSCGADDYVPKPLNPPELVSRVLGCLGARRDPSGQGGGAEFLLIQAALTGNKAAFEVLIQQFSTRLIDSLRASGMSVADAEDLASGAFIKAYERLHQFKGQSSFYTWLYRIAFNDSYHQRHRRPSVSLETMARGDETIWPVRLAVPDRGGEDLSQKVLHAEVRQAVSHIPKPYRQMLRWHFLRGVSYHLIARRLKIPPGTVMSRLFKAKQLLREAWTVNKK